MKPIKFEGHTISYTEAGHGDTTLLFVHGSFLNKEYWESQLNFFSQYFHVIAPDIPGHGKSPIGKDSMTIKHFGKAVVAFIQDLHLKNVILIGHSMGADVSLEVATSAPDSVIGIITIDYFKNIGTPLPREIVDKTKDGLKSDFKKTMETYVKAGLSTDQTDPSLVDRIVTDYQTMEPKAGSESILDQFAYIDREVLLLRKLKLKLHLINVDYSPTNEEALKKILKDKYSLTVIHGTSHFPMIENPEQFNETLKTVVEEVKQDQKETVEL